MRSILQKSISEIFKYNTHVSFEVFPPKTEHGLKQVYQTISNLKGLNPDFFSVTYGAGGSTAEKSLEIASAIANLAQVTCVAHFTCIGMDRQQVKLLLDSLAYHGIRNVLALRGDLPANDSNYQPPQNGFHYASELVSFIRENSDVGILVAGYPEGHKDCTTPENDFNHLVEKVKAGADGIVTQLFFENRHFLNFFERVKGQGINIPVMAGIFPISNGKQIERICHLSGAAIPDELKKGIEKYSENNEDMEKFGTEFAVKQVEELVRNGVDYFHFYTMNRHQQTRNILLQLKEYFPGLNFW